MTPESVLFKSPKGLEEIETRAHRLSPKLRQVLVRVDGAKTVDELIDEAGEMGEALLGQLEELVRNGFLVAEDTVPIPEPTPGPPVAREAGPAVEFNSPVKFKLQDLLVDAIGVDTGRMGKALEQCRNRAELVRWVELSLPFILQIAGKSKADAFQKSAKRLVG